MGGRLAGRRVVVTRAADFMGPAIVEVFGEEGAVVLPDMRDLRPVGAAAALIEEAGHVDVLIVNLIAPDPRVILEQDTTEELWQIMFDTMVHPLYRVVHAVLPQMKARRSGKIVVMGSANALRGTNNRSAYSAARGHRFHTCAAWASNLHLTTFISISWLSFLWRTPTSAPAGKVADLALRLPEIPVGRLAKGRESALFALYLAGPDSDFFVGQVVPFAGGWA